MTAGKQGCPCTNETATLSSLTERSCELAPTGESGVRLTLGGLCVPTSYGSSRCLQHDLHNDPTCTDYDGDGIIPPYCFRPFCYVDADVCARESNERVYRSDYFNVDSGVKIYYSYSTCNSIADDWMAAVSEKVAHLDLGQITIEANVPMYNLPMMYKRDPTSNEILTVTGSEYYNNNVPYEGVYPDFVENIMKISKGDIKNITYTHRSKVSSDLHPESSYTAAVQDIQDGLVDMGVGPFWITSERLLMSAFTIPVVYDRVYLVVPKPGLSNESFLQQVSKVLQPFEMQLWGLVIGIIIITGLLSVWFSDLSRRPSDHRSNFRQQKTEPLRRRKSAYARLAIDSILEKGMYFCSAGVEQDVGANLSNKLLMFGFGFFILIAVSSYVANLAAFLTQKSIEGSVTSIDGAIARGWKICAHSVFRKELGLLWPSAKFVFSDSGLEFHGLMDAYVEGECRALAVGWEDTSMDRTFLDRLCENGLVYTDSMFVEVPIAFPINPHLAAGFSYWITEAKRKHNLGLQAAKDQYIRENGEISSCKVRFSTEDLQSGDYDPITIKHMALPIILFIACCTLAIIGHLYERHNTKKHRSSLLGRTSQLNLVTDDPSHIPRALKAGGRISLGSNYTYKKDDDVEVVPIHNESDAEEKEDDFQDNGDPHLATGKSVIVGDF